MKKLTIAIALLFLIILGQALHLYLSLLSHQKNIIETARLVAEERTNLKEVIRAYEFFGKKNYLVIEGWDEYDREWIMWYVPESQQVEQKIRRERVYPLEQLHSFIESQYQIDQLIHIVPGLSPNGKPVWEAVFFDDDQRLQYVYFDLITGEQLRSYRLHNITSR